MIRKLLLGLFVVASVVALYFGYRYFVDVNTPLEDPVKAIPENAALVITGNNAHQLWSKLANTNIIWEELRSVSTVARMDELGKKVDSIMMQNEQLAAFIENNPVAVSVHLTGGTEYDFLFTAAVPDGMEDEIGLKAITDQFVKYSPTSFQGVNIYQVLALSKEEFYFLVNGGVFALSYSKVLMEDVVRHMNEGGHIAKSEAYAQVMPLAGNDAEANVFINFQYLPSVVATHMNTEGKTVVRPFVNFATSATFDITVESNSVMLNGFTYSSDSATNYLNIFKNQEPRGSDITGILPYNTAFFMQYRISNPEQFFLDYRFHLADIGGLQKYEADMAQLNSECGCNLPTYLLTWIGNEITLAATQEASNHEGHRYGIFETTNTNTAIERLNDLALLVAQKQGAEPVNIWIGDNVVGQIPIDSLHKKLFGYAFNDLTAPYYMAIDNYIVFANTIDALNDLVRNVKAERTLLHSESYNDFEDNLSQATNLFVYSNTARSPELYKQFLAEEHVGFIDANVELFRQFEAFALQIGHYKDDLFLTNAFLKHNPVYKEESSSLWELVLDTTIASPPYVVTDHTTGAKEILVQDSNNVIYLVSNTGKIQWQYQLDGPMIGEVQQIDAYQNNKLQLLLNTSSTLYLIDRLGRDVMGYPVTLPALASGTVGVVDYDNNRDYRLLVPCMDGMVYNYQAFGAPVDGWEFTGATAPVTSTPVHFKIQDKDYIFFIDEAMKTYVLDRKGAIRYTIGGTLDDISTNCKPVIELGKNIDETRVVYTDTAGTVVKLRFNGERDLLGFLPFSNRHRFLFSDVDGDKIKDYIFTDSNHVWVYGADEQLKFDLGFEENIELDPGVYPAPGGAAYLGITLSNLAEVYLFDQFGVLQGDMPFVGNGVLGVADLNKDGTCNVVVGNRGKILYTYNLN